MEKKISSPSDSSSSSEDTTTTVKTVIAAHAKKTPKLRRTSSSESAVAVGSNTSTCGDSIESLESDPAIYSAQSAVASHPPIPGGSSSQTFYTGKASSLPDINIISASDDGASAPKKPRLFEKQDTLSDAESISPDVTPSEEHASTALGMHSKGAAAQGKSTPSATSPRPRPTDLKVKSCLEDTSSSAAQSKQSGVTRDVVLTPMPPAGLPYPGMEVFKIPLQPQSSSERAPPPPIAEDDADEAMSVDVSPDESSSESSVVTVRAASEGSESVMVTSASAPATPAGAPVAGSGARTASIQEPAEGSMDVSEDDAARS